MRNHDGYWIPPPARDLIAELERNHRLNFDWRAIAGLVDKPKEENDAGIELIIDIGNAHEYNLLKKN